MAPTCISSCPVWVSTLIAFNFSHFSWRCKPWRTRTLKGLKVLLKSQLYSEHLTIHTRGLRRVTWVRCWIARTTHMWQNVCFHRDRWITTAKLNSLLPATPGRSMKTQSKNTSVLRGTEGTGLLFPWGFPTSTQYSHMTPFWDCVLTLQWWTGM